jgi:hypothetical protein
MKTQTTQAVTFRFPQHVINSIKKEKNQTRFVIEAIEKAVAQKKALHFFSWTEEQQRKNTTTGMKLSTKKQTIDAIRKIREE